MADNDLQTNDQQRILDARMEYGHLFTAFITLANMFWLGFGAFFALNTLLATVLGVSYSANAGQLGVMALKAIHILVPLTGMFIAGVAAYTAVQISDFQRLANERGRELEADVLQAKMFTRMLSRSDGQPLPTIIGAVFFCMLWASALYAAF